MVGFAYALVLMGTVGVMFQLGPRFTDIGYDRGTAMALVSLTALIATIGKTVWGTLCDRYDPRRVVAVLMAMNGIGLCLALVPESKLALSAFILLFGFAMGGIMSTLPILVADLYGRESFASVSRFMSLFIILEVGGYMLMGHELRQDRIVRQGLRRLCSPGPCRGRPRLRGLAPAHPGCRRAYPTHFMNAAKKAGEDGNEWGEAS